MTLFGPDISSYQTGIDLSKLPGDLVLIKATGGTSYLNPDCDRAYQQAKAAGKKVGVYHYVHERGCAGSAAEEARWFIKNIQNYLGEAIPVMDWEEADIVADSAYAREFQQVFEAEAVVRLMGYGSTSQLEALRACHEAGMPIWAAGYSLGYQPIDGYNPPQGPIGVPDGFTVSMWQYTSSGRLPGWDGNLDLNEFYGDASAWDKLAARLDGTPAPAPVAVEASPAPVEQAPAAPAVGGQCTVSAGDSLSSIGTQVGVNWQDIAALNGINAPYTIQPGQLLNLPEGANLAALGGSTPAAPALPPYCTVDPEDTLTSIAEQYGVSVDYIIARNPGINADLIFPGQRINL